MQEWYTAIEFAKGQLPDLPRTESGIISRLKREGWQSTDKARKRQGRGGGWEYHFSLLPMPARNALVVRAYQANQNIEKQAFEENLAPIQTPPIQAPPIQTPPTQASGEVDGRTGARLLVLALLQDFVTQTGLTFKQARPRFADLYNARQLAGVPDWVYAHQIKLADRTLRRWQNLKQKSGSKALAAGYGNRQGSGTIDKNDDLRSLIIATICQKPHLSVPLIYDYVLAKSKDGFKPPSLRSLQKWVKEWKADNAATLLYHTNPDAYRSKYQVAIGSMYDSVIAPNALWEIDASPIDMLLVDEEGKARRYTLYMIVDIYTRRALALITETAKTDSALQLIRKAVIAWGVPDTIRTDNGSDFTSYRMETVLADLDITQQICKPFTPESKAAVERMIGTYQRKFISLLDGFIGHSVKDRKAIEERTAFAKRLGEDMRDCLVVQHNPDYVQSLSDNWLNNLYGNAPHQGLGGKSPNFKFSQWQGTLATIEDVRALDALLQPAPRVGDKPVGIRMVGKRGILLNKQSFWCDELAHYMGQEVFVRLDDDMGRVNVYALDKKGAASGFIGVALNPDHVGISREDMAKQAKAYQKQVLQEANKEARKIARNVKPEDMAEIILARGGPDSNILPMPKPTETHKTAALIAVKEAANSADDGEWEPYEASPEEKAKHAEFVAQFQAKQNVTILEESPTHQKNRRVLRALKINEALESNSYVSDEDRGWLDGYSHTPEYRAEMKMVESFGTAYLNS